VRQLRMRCWLVRRLIFSGVCCVYILSGVNAELVRVRDEGSIVGKGWSLMFNLRLEATNNFADASASSPVMSPRQVKSKN
jgi:hypothetical protein